MVAHRKYEQRIAVRRDRKYLQLKRTLMAAITTSMTLSQADLPRVSPGDVPILCRLALDMLRALRGEEERRIVLALEAWDILPYLARILERKHRSRSIQALTLLSHFDSGQSLALLKKSMGAEDMYVQLAALRGLARRGAVEMLEEIPAQLFRTGQRNTFMLADILQRFGEEAVPVLLELAKSGALAEVRIACIMALASIGSFAAVLPLIALASDPLPDIRAQSIAALARLGDERAGTAVLKALGETDDAVRVQAAQAAGLLNLQSAAGKLVELLGCSNWWIRYRAAEALFRIGAPGQALLRSACAGPAVVGEIATQTLGEMLGIVA